MGVTILVTNSLCGKLPKWSGFGLRAFGLVLGLGLVWNKLSSMYFFMRCTYRTFQFPPSPPEMTIVSPCHLENEHFSHSSNECQYFILKLNAGIPHGLKNHEKKAFTS
jgi:hypothetical protein